MRRKSWFVLGLVLCAMLATATMPRYSAAQDNGEANAVAEEPGNEDAKPADAGDTAEPDGQQIEGFLHWVFRCSGFIGLVILLLSVYFVSTVTRLFWEMRIEVAAPPEVVLQCEGLL